jgi:osmoprotectant transport system permease protein
MDIFAHLLSWLTSNWAGVEGVQLRTIEHFQMSVQATALGALVAVPAGLFVGHTRRFEFAVVQIANLGRALPAFGIIGIVTPFTINLPGFGFWPTLIALFLLSLPPILTNTYVGVKNVDPDTVEAARGMGLSGRQVLLKLELPLAGPLIVAGIRNAAVAVVATATLAALVGWGGYGRFIVDGFAQGERIMVVAGAVLVAVMSVAAEVLLGGVERLVRPRRTSGERRLSLRSGGPRP